MILGENGLLTLLANGAFAYFYKQGNNTIVLGGDKVATANVEIMRIDTGDRLVVDLNQNLADIRLQSPITSFYPGGLTRGFVDSTTWQFQHQMRLGYISNSFSVTTLTADVNDLAPTNIGICSVLAFTDDGLPHNITGIASGGGNGRLLVILNYGTATHQLKHASTLSAADNRFLGPSGVDRAIAPNEMLVSVLMSASGLTRWRLPK